MDIAPRKSLTKRQKVSELERARRTAYSERRKIMAEIEKLQNYSATLLIRIKDIDVELEQLNHA